MIATTPECHKLGSESCFLLKEGRNFDGKIPNASKWSKFSMGFLDNSASKFSLFLLGLLALFWRFFVRAKVGFYRLYVKHFLGNAMQSDFSN